LVDVARHGRRRCAEAALARYRAEDDKDPKYVERLIEANAKRDLGWFFDDWVYQDRGLPDFRVQSAHPWKSDKDVQFVTVTLENLAMRARRFIHHYVGRRRGHQSN